MNGHHIYIVCADVIGAAGYEFENAGVFSDLDKAREFKKSLKFADWAHIEIWTVDLPNYHQTYTGE